MTTNPVEYLYGPHVRDKISLQGGSGKPWGYGTVSSGDAGVTVSNTHAYSGHAFFVQVVMDTRCPSAGLANYLEVSSIIDGTSFDVIMADGVAEARDVTFSYIIFPLS